MSRNDASGLRKVSKTCENCSSVLRLAMLSEWTILYSVWCLCYVWRLMYYVTACRPTLFNIIIIPNKYMYVCNFRQKVSTVTSVRRTSAGILHHYMSNSVHFWAKFLVPVTLLTGAPEPRGQRGRLPPLPLLYGGARGQRNALFYKTIHNCIRIKTA